MSVLGLRHRLQQGQALPEMRCGFLMRPTLKRLLSGAVPVADRLGRQAGSSGVVGEQVGLGSHHGGVVLFQHLDNAAVILLPRLLQ